MKEIKKLNKTDFFDIYIISLILKNDPDMQEQVLPRLLQVAKQYIDITDKAIRSELRHSKMAGEDDGWDTYIPTKKTKSIYHNRFKLSLSKIEKFFNNEPWDSEFGGKAWGNITEGLINLIKECKEKNVLKIISAIDRLNDLEHNRDLYLKSYCTFYLQDALDYKYQKNDFLKYGTPEIQALYNQSTSLVRKYHKQGEFINV